MAEAWILTVSQLNEYVRRTLAGDPMLTRVTLRGEVSNFKRHSAGHLYFSLKDAQARINCVMFRQYADACNLSLADGMRIVATGSVGLFARDGQYQLYVSQVRADGVGDLYQQFEMLKQKLAAQGLFDASLKRPLPLLPKTVGIVSSPTGAVIRDIQNVAWRRNPRARLLLCPSSVQGARAADEIVQGIRLLSRLEEVDVIILARGGGSMEDLWPFNEEKVARAIRASRVPVVSAVGHETDYTIADFAADLRAPTPSAAAEVVVPNVNELSDQLDALKNALTVQQVRSMSLLRYRLSALHTAMRAHHPSQRLREHAIRLDAIHDRLLRAGQAACQQRDQALSALHGRLQALGAPSVLARGYAIVLQDGNVVSSIRQLKSGGQATLQLYDGSARVQILSLREEYGNGDTEKGNKADV